MTPSCTDGASPRPVLGERHIPFLIAGLVLAGLAAGLAEMPSRADTFPEGAASSTTEVPHLMEYFPSADCIDCRIHATPFTHESESNAFNAIWMTWAEHEADPMGILAGEIRAENHNVSAPAMVIDGEDLSEHEDGNFAPLRTMEAMSDHLREHENAEAKAELAVKLRWVDGPEGLTLNMTVDITTLETLSDTSILEMHILDDGPVTPGGEEMVQVVRLYRFTLGFHHAANMNSTHWEAFPMADLADYGLSTDPRETEDWRMVVLLRDKEARTTHAGLDMPLPPAPFGPNDSGERILVGIGAGVILFAMAGIVHAEWKRENLLPRLHGTTVAHTGSAKIREGVAILRAGKAPVVLKGVRAEEPWRLSGKSPTMEIEAGGTAEIKVRFRAGEDAQSTSVSSRWSLDVDGMGAWVMDLEFDPE